ncbi:DNA-binding protein [Candidatus Falkowbacteria bacterium]|nr:DNA-binding protein [Candidatus Falkowbacteria bacterium]
MKIKKIDEKIYLLRLERGEEVMETMMGFCTDKDIKGGYFQAIGAMSEVELALYELESKKYYDKKIQGPLEIVSLFAVISAKKIHAHIVVSDKEMKAIGGHLKKGIVAATCEVVLHVFDCEIGRYADEEIGLELLDI